MPIKKLSFLQEGISIFLGDLNGDKNLSEKMNILFSQGRIYVPGFPYCNREQKQQINNEQTFFKSN